MCAEPEGVMEQEQMLLAALETVATAQVEGDRLELRRADGALALSATRDGGG
jgi:heat shock protein HslJ